MKTKSLAAFLSLAFCCASSTRAVTLEWIRQFGTAADDYGRGVSADGLGSVYISGSRGPAAGFHDAFLSKYDADGTLEWTRQFGTSEDDQAWGVSADGLGNVYVAGRTEGDLGGPNAGGGDAFLSKYDAGGTLQWIRQFGTGDNLEVDYGWAVSADGLGSVYISGWTDGNLAAPNIGRQDAFLSKYDASGSLKWIRQFGTSQADVSYGISADGLGNVYISGETSGSLGGDNMGRRDAFLSKYDASGTLKWTRQFGTSGSDDNAGVAADGLGNVYVAGGMKAVDGRKRDAFLSKYDPDGSLEWSQLLATSSDDVTLGVTADGFGGVYVTGSTEGSLTGTNAGAFDAFLSRYDADGTLRWTQQFGTSQIDTSNGVSVDGRGGVYISGWTKGSLGRTSAGGVDAFVAKFSTTIPEPTTVMMLLAGGLVGILLRRGRRG